MKTLTCPCCGGYMGELPEADRIRNTLSKTEGRIFLALHEVSPDGLSLTVIAGIAQPKRPVDKYSMQVAKVLVSKLRKRVAPFGFYIPKNKPHSPADYRLLPMEVGQ